MLMWFLGGECSVDPVGQVEDQEERHGHDDVQHRRSYR